MTNLERDVYNAVQAALLNSECSGTQAIIAASKAIADFAHNEDLPIDSALETIRVTVVESMIVTGPGAVGIDLG